jgi:sugar phosphate isomerase/epimerase
MKVKKKIKVGIVQGRLSESPVNRLQFFPKDYKSEFPLAKKIGFDYIEFFSERKLNLNNPVWNKKDLKNYHFLSKQFNLINYTFCDDFIISNSIKEKKTKIYLKNLIYQISKLNIKNLILPLYGKSLMTDFNYNQYVYTIKKILAHKKKLTIFLESNISPLTFLDIKKNKGFNNLKFLFDTGNRAILNRNLYEDVLSFGKHIGHIHIKDKNNEKKNVKLGNGIVDFKKFFNCLKKINYNGNITLETPREKNFIQSAKNNYKFVKKYLR